MLYIFDMGGVVTTTCKIEKELENALGISYEKFLEYCGAEDKNCLTVSGKTDLLSLHSDGKINSKKFWEVFSERSGIKVKTDWWHWLFHPELNEKTVEIIKKLKAKGHRVVCGTNTVDSHYMNHIERGDYSYFDQTYTSCYMGVSKPNPEFWKIILFAEKASPSETVFIDDRKDNCDAASSLGIKAIQFTSAENLEKEIFNC